MGAPETPQLDRFPLGHSPLDLRGSPGFAGPSQTSIYDFGIGDFSMEFDFPNWPEDSTPEPLPEDEPPNPGDPDNGDLELDGDGNLTIVFEGDTYVVGGGSGLLSIPFTCGGTTVVLDGTTEILHTQDIGRAGRWLVSFGVEYTGDSSSVVIRCIPSAGGGAGPDVAFHGVAAWSGADALGTLGVYTAIVDTTIASEVLVVEAVVEAGDGSTNSVTLQNGYVFFLGDSA